MPIRTPDGYLDITNATLRGSEIITTSNVGIANSAPTHTLSVGNKLFVDDSAANVLTVSGNLVATSLKIGQIDLAPSYGLEHVANVGNTISNVVQFTNTGTGFVSASNVGIGTTTTPAGLLDVVGSFRMRYQDMGVTKAHIITGANSTSITESGGVYTYTRAGSGNTGNFLPNPSNIVPKVGQRYRVKLTARSDYAGTIRYECPTSTIITTYDLTTTFKEYIWDFTATGTTMQFAVTTALGTTSQFNALSIERLGVGFNVNPTSTTAPIQFSGVTHFSDNVGIGTETVDAPLHVFKQQTNGLNGTTDGGGIKLERYGNYGCAIWSQLVDNTTDTMSFRVVNNATDAYGGVPQMVLTHTGKLGIGTASPTSMLELAANGGSSMITLKRTSASNGGAKGGIRFTENTNGYNVGTIACLGDGANTSGALCFYTKASSTETGIYLPTTDERMRISSSGNVGIGTNNPVSKFDVWDGASNGTNIQQNAFIYLRNPANAATNYGAAIVFENTDGAAGNRKGLGRIAALRENNAGSYSSFLQFSPAANGTEFEAMRMTSSGNVGIGTLSPVRKLEIYTGNGSTPGLRLRRYPTGGTYTDLRHADSPDGLAIHTSDGNVTTLEVMRICGFNGGRVGIGTVIPGEKLHVHENLSTSNHQIAARIGGYTSSYNTLVFGSNHGRPHIGGHRGDYGAWADLSFQNDLMVLKQSNMRVGINTSSPAFPLDVSFSGDSGAAIRSTNSHASLNFFPSSGYSYLRFHEGNGTASVWLQALAGGHLAIRPQAGGEVIRFTAAGDIDMNYGEINFGSRTTQHLNLWGTVYGMGVQSNTLYFRTGDDFAFHEDGTHSNSRCDPGSGGSMRMVIKSGGFVGINVANPLSPLHVSGTGGTTGQSRYFNYSGGMSGTNQYLGSVTLRTSNGILSGDYVAVASDERIKKNIVDADDAECLEVLRQLKPKKYGYRDVVERGEDPVWGFIAQEVMDVLPYSTKLTQEIIPNIYELANVSSSNVITFTNFNTADLESNATTLIKTKGIDGEDHDIHLAEVIDTHSIRVKEDLTNFTGSIDAEGNVISEITTTTITPEEYEALEDKTGFDKNDDDTYTKTSTTYPGNQFFVYGQQVDDFVYLKKESIWTVATAALQEVDRQLQAEKTKTTALETKTATLETKLQEAEAKTTALETKLQEAEAKITTLQAEKEAMRSDFSSLVLRVAALES